MNDEQNVIISEKNPNITITADFGDKTNLRILSRLFDAIMQNLEFHMNIKGRLPLKIQIMSIAENPEARVKQNLIILASTSLLRRAQAAYQFSHEYCHWLINGEKTRYLWLEESICEATAQFIISELPHMNLHDKALMSPLNKRTFITYQGSPDVAYWKMDARFLDSPGAEQTLKSLHFEETSNVRPHITYLANQITPLLRQDKSRFRDVPLLGTVSDSMSFEGILKGLATRGETDLWIKVSKIFGVQA